MAKFYIYDDYSVSMSTKNEEKKIKATYPIFSYEGCLTNIFPQMPSKHKKVIENYINEHHLKRRIV